MATYKSHRQTTQDDSQENMEINKTSRCLQCTLFGLKLTSYTIGAILLIAFCFTYNNNNSPMVSVDTDYIHWVTHLPAISVCPAVNRRFVGDRLKRLVKGVSVDSNNISFFSNLLRPGKLYCLGCSGVPPAHPHLLVNISQTVLSVQEPCESQLTQCSWNDIQFTCCQLFKQLTTKHGICYSINSLLTESDDSTNHPFQFVASVPQPKATLRINTSLSIMVAIHDRKQLPAIKKGIVIKKGMQGQVIYKFHETNAHHTAYELTVKQRKCSLKDLHVKGFKTYSSSVCRVACLANKQTEACGCKHHLLTGDGKNCDWQGLRCLDDKFGNRTNIKKGCTCLRNCLEQHIGIVYKSTKPTNRGQAIVEVTLLQPPTERHILLSRTNKLEILVGFACFVRMTTGTTFEGIIRSGWFLISTYFAAFTRMLHHIQVIFMKFKKHRD